MIWLAIAIGVLAVVWLVAFAVIWWEGRSLADEDEQLERGEWWR